MLPGFDRLSFWYEQRVDEDEYEALAEWYWQGKREVLGEKFFSIASSFTNLSWAGPGVEPGPPWRENVHKQATDGTTFRLPKLSWIVL